MRFISIQENLKKGLNIVGHVTTKNINLPILNNILLKAENGNIELIATNLEIGVIHKMRGKIEKDGQFTVDSRLITDYVNLLGNDEKVKVEEKDGELKIECGNYKTKIKGESSKDFPLIPIISKKSFYQCAPDDFRKALASVVFSVSGSENRMELTGVLFSFQEGRVSLVATDSYRLAEKTLSIKFLNEDGAKIDQEDQKVIVPAKTIQELLRILNNWSSASIGEEEKIRIYLSENQILFTIDSIELVSRLINGQYPDYKQVVPTKSKTKATVERLEFLRAVKASALFSRTGINDISLKFVKSKIILSSCSGISGESQIELPCQIDGEENEITVNHRYLVDGLNNIEDDLVEVSVLNGDTPCVLHPKKDKDYLYIVMPIRQ